jgi:hypothetical protein
MWLGAENPDCCNGGFEGAERGDGSELTSAMKLKFYPPFKDEGELIASWGQAQLIKYLDGRTDLRGGSEQDRAEAREWISLFWQTAVVGEGSGGRS